MESGGVGALQYFVTNCGVRRYTICILACDLIIAHPPCTCLSVSGNRTYGLNTDGTPKEKHHMRLEAAEWTEGLWNACLKVCDKVCFENPVGVLPTLTNMPKPKYIQPYQFGHLEQKKTGLFLHGLKPLQDTDNVYEKMMMLPKNVRERLFYLPPSKDRWKIRSTTYKGIADAIASQWV